MLNSILLLLFIILIFLVFFNKFKFTKKTNRKIKNISKDSNNLIYLYTFCVDIGRHSRNNLIETLKILVKSLNKFVPNFVLIVFTNFKINFNHTNIIYREYYQGEVKLYNDTSKELWHELCFNRLNIFKDLYNEFNKSFIWIDLDTIILYDISYLNNYDNAFIINGGLIKNNWKLFKNSDKYNVLHKNYIQGNLWKLNLDIYYKLIKTLNEDVKFNNLEIDYDVQGLFNYHIYFKDNENNYNLFGKNINKNIIYGLSVWEDPKINKSNHGDQKGINNLYFNNGKFKTKYNPEYDVHIISITFFEIINLLKNKNNKLFNFLK